MGPIKEILAETQFQEELTSSSQTKLVVVDFTASWCGPCQTIAPFYEQLSRKYPNAVFLKVDVDKCQETAVNQRVSVMPTFHFYRNKVKVDSMQGADPQKLEEKIQKYYDDGTAENDVGVAGHVGSKKSKHKKPKPHSEYESESKSSDGRKHKTEKKKKSPDKGKHDKEVKNEPEPGVSRMVSTHNIEEPKNGNRRRSLKELAKNMFKKGSHDDAKEKGRAGSPPPSTRRSFKEVMHDLFHPHSKSVPRASQVAKKSKNSKTNKKTKDKS